ncbi:hypothetical protein RFI_14282 [Reticulomyxa filosa]|uniref:Uncharacterized protein n=1 Tax=Reticulomyxa filosa TaxID=46433 RepID=X6NC78_RETFI|nr:hypothetical protein RFI_14282 [Reticulomyxa filosa]|eukprot:ETO22912.1 hypothetical protein RFI_14282 [Reticulomyxa filosa]
MCAKSRCLIELYKSDANMISQHEVAMNLILKAVELCKINPKCVYFVLCEWNEKYLDQCFRLTNKIVTYHSSIFSGMLYATCSMRPSKRIRTGEEEKKKKQKQQKPSHPTFCCYKEKITEDVMKLQLKWRCNVLYILANMKGRVSDGTNNHNGDDTKKFDAVVSFWNMSQIYAKYIQDNFGDWQLVRFRKMVLQLWEKCETQKSMRCHTSCVNWYMDYMIDIAQCKKVIKLEYLQSNLKCCEEYIEMSKKDEKELKLFYLILCRTIYCVSISQYAMTHRNTQWKMFVQSLDSLWADFQSLLEVYHSTLNVSFFQKLQQSEDMAVTASNVGNEKHDNRLLKLLLQCIKHSSNVVFEIQHFLEVANLPLEKEHKAMQLQVVTCVTKLLLHFRELISKMIDLWGNLDYNKLTVGSNALYRLWESLLACGGMLEENTRKQQAMQTSPHPAIPSLDDVVSIIKKTYKFLSPPNNPCSDKDFVSHFIGKLTTYTNAMQCNGIYMYAYKKQYNTMTKKKKNEKSGGGNNRNGKSICTLYGDHKMLSYCEKMLSTCLLHCEQVQKGYEMIGRSIVRELERLNVKYMANTIDLKRAKHPNLLLLLQSFVNYQLTSQKQNTQTKSSEQQQQQRRCSLSLMDVLENIGSVDFKAFHPKLIIQLLEGQLKSNCYRTSNRSFFSFFFFLQKKKYVYLFCNVPMSTMCCVTTDKYHQQVLETLLERCYVDEDVYCIERAQTLIRLAKLLRVMQPLIDDLQGNGNANDKENKMEGNLNGFDLEKLDIIMADEKDEARQTHLLFPSDNDWSSVYDHQTSHRSGTDPNPNDDPEVEESYWQTRNPVTLLENALDLLQRSKECNTNISDESLVCVCVRKRQYKCYICVYTYIYKEKVDDMLASAHLWLGICKREMQACKKAIMEQLSIILSANKHGDELQDTNFGFSHFFEAMDLWTDLIQRQCHKKCDHLQVHRNLKENNVNNNINKNDRQKKPKTDSTAKEREKEKEGDMTVFQCDQCHQSFCDVYDTIDNLQVLLDVLHLYNLIPHEIFVLDAMIRLLSTLSDVNMYCKEYRYLCFCWLGQSYHRLGHTAQAQQIFEEVRQEVIDPSSSNEILEKRKKSDANTNAKNNEHEKDKDNKMSTHVVD